jgi:hypothetical protein
MGAPQEGQFAVKTLMIHPLFGTLPNVGPVLTLPFDNPKYLRHERPTSAEVARTRAIQGVRDSSKD